MKNKPINFLAFIILFVLGVVAVVTIIVVSNQPKKTSQTNTSEPAKNSELQVVYPAPKLSPAERTNLAQGAYPPPAMKTAVITNTAPSTKVSPSPTTKSNLTLDSVQRTSVDEAKSAFDINKAVFLDVRSTQSYAQSHIPGAISIPEIEINERLNELDPDQWIITYCS